MLKSKKCKVCNKKYSGNNRFYGSSCINNLYSIANITNTKEIEDKELFLHCAIILKLHKTDVSNEKLNDICESYLSKEYFQNIEEVRLKIIKEKLDICINENKKTIMKLNTAYRVTNILKRNKEKISLVNDDFDKEIDETILKFFKHYFTLTKLLDNKDYEVYYYMQLLFWEIVIIGGKFKNFELSAKCLSNALVVIGSKPNDIHITDKDKEIIQMIKNDEGLKEKIRSVIKKYSKNNLILFNQDTVKDKNELLYSFKMGDLSLALHSVTLTIDGIKENNKWNLKIKLIDNYDFTEILSNDKFTKGSKEYLNLGIALNDMAVISTQYGVISSYDIIISFVWNDFDV